MFWFQILFMCLWFSSLGFISLVVSCVFGYDFILLLFCSSKCFPACIAFCLVPVFMDFSSSLFLCFSAFFSVFNIWVFFYFFPGFTVFTVRPFSDLTSCLYDCLHLFYCRPCVNDRSSEINSHPSHISAAIGTFIKRNSDSEWIRYLWQLQREKVKNVI